MSVRITVIDNDTGEILLENDMINVALVSTLTTPNPDGSFRRAALFVGSKTELFAMAREMVDKLVETVAEVEVPPS